jgi:hypothetical protein
MCAFDIHAIHGCLSSAGFAHILRAAVVFYSHLKTVFVAQALIDDVITHAIAVLVTVFIIPAVNQTKAFSKIIDALTRAGHIAILVLRTVTGIQALIDIVQALARPFFIAIFFQEAIVCGNALK